MRYTPPSIIATYAAQSVIQMAKGAGVQEIGTQFLTSGPAYEADE